MRAEVLAGKRTRAPAASPRTIQEAFGMGQTLAMSDPNFLPLLHDAHQYPNYVLFMLAHRKRLETMPRFWTWDLRLEDLIENEAERQSLSMTPANAEQMLRVIATPIRCAFWYGWESAQNLLKRYEEATGIRNHAPTTKVFVAEPVSLEARLENAEKLAARIAAREAAAEHAVATGNVLGNAL